MVQISGTLPILVDLQADATNRPSVSLVGIFLKARELERKGKDVIHFDAGEPDYSPPRSVVHATIKALVEGKGHYTESGGIPEVKRAIARHVEKKNHVSVSEDKILVTAGGRLALYYSFATLPKRSKIGIVSPDWPAYRELAQLFDHGIEFFRTDLDNNWNLDLDQLRASDCNALILNYPNNPTGKVLDLSAFEELVRIASQRKMTIISDEVYSSFRFNEQKPFKSVLETTDLQYVFVTSLSKDYAMTGFRAAYAISDPKTISRMSKLNALIMTSAPEFVQYAIIAAMESDEFVKRNVAIVKKRRDAAVRALESRLNVELYSPDCSLYLFPRVATKGFDSEKFALDLLEKKFVSIAPGSTFGSSYNKHFRMTLLQDEKRIEEGIE